MKPELKFKLDYVSDFSNLIIILAGFDGKPQPWNHQLEIEESKVKKLKNIEKEEFLKAERQRKIGDSYKEWKNKTNSYDFWPLLDEIENLYHEYWTSRRDKLEQNLKEKKKIWDEKHQSFFQKAEKFTDLSWEKEEYIAVISDSIYQGGYWDTFGKNGVYIGAYSNSEVFNYVVTHELLHLLLEDEKYPKDYFNLEGYPELLTHDLFELLIPMIQSEITSLELDSALHFLSYSPDRRWVLFKQVIKAFDPDKDFKEIIKNLRDRLKKNKGSLDNYKKIVQEKSPESILIRKNKK